MRSLTSPPTQARGDIVKVINNTDNDYNKVLNGNFVGLYCLTSWFETKINDKNELVDFDLTRLRTQFLIKIKKILARLRFPNFIIINALYFLDLIKEYILKYDGNKKGEDYPVLYKTKEDNLFLNFIVCLMVSNKSSNDFAMKSKYWSRLTKIPIRKINELELVLLNLILKHNVLVLNFNIQKLVKFNNNLQSKITPFKSYIDDFNARFKATYTNVQQSKSVASSPQASPKPVQYNSSPSETSLASSSRVSPSSSYAGGQSSASEYSISPKSNNSSNSCVYNCKSVPDVKIQTITSSVNSLEEFIQTPTTNFKKVNPSVPASMKGFYHTTLPNPYNYVDIERTVQKQQEENRDIEPRYRNNYCSLEIYHC